MNKRTAGDRVFGVIVTLILILCAVIALVPLISVLALSFSSKVAVNTNAVTLWPVGFTFDSWAAITGRPDMWRATLVTVITTLVGTTLALAITSLLAYPLSKKDLPFRNLFTAMIVTTMFISGGMIPTYLLVNNTLHLRNSYFAIILPACVSSSHVIIARNYFMTLPNELEEAATIDGANSVQVLMRVILPLSAPILATISLWVIVSNWNAYFNCLLYITDPNKYVLQVVLRRIILTDSKEMTSVAETIANQTDTDIVTLRAASIMLATIPIICVYPFLQKYFVKGVLIGSLKG